eukprot:TRINITY_DN1743_c0_g1_i1.p1 TRINITY_DN1743_c0_g1~~TRINITY_DN1743_c0_g1_i1.p1  ORF type:complete len:174 (+),score=14.57 TRINITY_DN1743_c0_g1_i1:239-760(+)
MEFSVRELRLEDAETYWKIRIEALESDPLAFGAAVEEHLEDGFKNVTSRHLKDIPDGNFALGAFTSDQRLIGIVGFLRSDRIKEKHLGSLVAMYVKAEARGKGVARALVEKLLSRARTYEGLERINLAVALHAVAAQKLYRSFGFVPYGVEPKAIKYNGQYSDTQLMGLDLSD